MHDQRSVNTIRLPFCLGARGPQSLIAIGMIGLDSLQQDMAQLLMAL